MFRLFLKKLLLFLKKYDIIIHVAQGYSSAGRVPVSKTVGRGFESSCPCQNKKHHLRWCFLFWHESSEAEKPRVRCHQKQGGERQRKVKITLKEGKSLGHLATERSEDGFRILLPLPKHHLRWCFLFWHESSEAEKPRVRCREKSLSKRRGIVKIGKNIQSVQVFARVTAKNLSTAVSPFLDGSDGIFE